MLHFLALPPAARDSLGGKAASDALAQGAGSILLIVALAAWIIAWRFFRIEKQGKKYFLYNFFFALAYLPFLSWHFFRCYEKSFTTGTEHYLFFFFLHSVVVLFWSLGFNGRNRKEEFY